MEFGGVFVGHGQLNSKAKNAAVSAPKFSATMATKISSGEAFRVLNKWKEEGTGLSAICIIRDATVFVLWQSSIKQLSRDSVSIAGDNGEILLWLDEATDFAFAGVEDVPPNIQGKIAAKRCLQILRGTNSFYLSERVMIGTSGEYIH
ncbi:hypothetical protein MYX77_09230 [Acidobacteriia bacterium AH_259_A11_L15]|nr:hypothetical protein [Acidobacteriia bacterium AH_259_A11_L15]